MNYGAAENQKSKPTFAAERDRALLNTRPATYSDQANQLLGTALGQQKQEPEIQRELQTMDRTIEYLHENLRELAARLSPVMQPMTENECAGKAMPAINTDMGTQIFHMNTRAYSAAREIASLVERLAI
jgi:hypothetical protein